jgi:trans-2,3-dihydro-3-hydroxyanthranilate isomerase
MEEMAGFDGVDAVGTVRVEGARTVIDAVLGDAADALEYVIVDVFTPAAGRSFAGNPLAVVLGADALTTEQCQALAVEFNLSETVFPLEPTTPDAHYRARIFTPSSELPFAGHPSVGVAWTLHQLGRLPAGEVTQECGAGLVALQIPDDGGPVTLTGPAPTMSEPLDHSPLLAAVHLTAADLGDLPPRSGGSGIPFVYLNVRPEALAKVSPDLAALAALDPPVTGIHLSAFDAGHRFGLARVRGLAGLVRARGRRRDRVHDQPGCRDGPAVGALLRRRGEERADPAGTRGRLHGSRRVGTHPHPVAVDSRLFVGGWA